MSVNCNYHNIELPRIVYARSQSSGGCCGGGILSGLLSGVGCGRGNNFVNGLLTGGLIGGAVLLCKNLFNNEGGVLSGIFGGGCDWLSGATSMFGGLGGGYGVIPSSSAELAALWSCSPLGQLGLAYQQEATLAEFAEELKPMVDEAIKASGIEIAEDSIEYKDMHAKACAIKTANPEISDDELKTRLKNYAIAANFDDNLVNLATEKIKKIDITDGSTEEESKGAYLDLGKGYVELMDENNDGNVTSSEFIAHEIAILGTDISAEDKKKAEKQAQTIFVLLDENKNNRIDAEEFAAYNRMQATYTDTGTSTANDLTVAENTAFANAQLAAVENLLDEESQGVEAAEFREKYENHLSLFREPTTEE